ncbi:pathogenicity island protein [Gemella morbillorum]
MNIEKIKSDLVKLIKHKKDVSFVEIENYFDEIGFKYQGDISICRKNENITLWSGWNTRATELLYDLLNSELITMRPTTKLIYFIDGKVLTLPVYEGNKPYNQWLPVEFN